MTPQDQQQQQIQQVGGTETVREQDKIMLVLAYLALPLAHPAAHGEGLASS